MQFSAAAATSTVARRREAPSKWVWLRECSGGSWCFSGGEEEEGGESAVSSESSFSPRPAPKDMKVIPCPKLSCSGRQRSKPPVYICKNVRNFLAIFGRENVKKCEIIVKSH